MLTVVTVSTLLWEVAGLQNSEWGTLLGNLQLRFAGGNLLVSSEHQLTSTLMDVIEQAYLKVVKWRSFSSSRYGGLATSSQQLLASHLLGLADIVDSVLGGETSDFYFKGYSRFHSRVAELVAVAAVAALAHQRVLEILAKDDMSSS